MPQWFFKKARPGDRARESQVEKFFRSDALRNPATALVREGIQNSLDAASGGTPVSVRIGLYELDIPATAPNLSGFFSGLFEHIDAVRNKLVDAPTRQEPCRLLVFEDFGTTGLQGDPAQWWPEEGKHNPFFNFFRGEGISDKEQGARGRHGVGKFVFAAASRVKAIFGVTRRLCDGQRLLMGTAVLRLHSIGDCHFMPDGWFGCRDNRGLVLPVKDAAFVDEFTGVFGLTRRPDENGLSIVVPWLDPSIDGGSILDAVLRGFFFPIRRGELTVEIRCGDRHSVINDRSIKDIVATQNDALRDEVTPFLKLAQFALEQQDPPKLNLPTPGAPRWEANLLSDSLKKA